MRLSLILTWLLLCVAPLQTFAQPIQEVRSGAYSVSVVDERGVVLPTFAHHGRTYVLGHAGSRYLVRVRNGSPHRVEAVVSVDGRDVMDGRPAALDKRGYLVEPYGEVTVDGYRLSEGSVAAFRFGSVRDSYAAQMGSARDVGVIGVAVFSERNDSAWRHAPYGRAEGVPAPSRKSAERPMDAAEAPMPAPGAGHAPAAAPQMSVRRERSGLGTEFGEEHASASYSVHFERASANPDVVLSLRYNDRRGLLALGIPVDGPSDRETWTRETAEPFRQSGSFATPPPHWTR